MMQSRVLIRYPRQDHKTSQASYVFLHIKSSKKQHVRSDKSLQHI